MAEIIYNKKNLKMFCTPKCGISNFRGMINNGIFDNEFNLDKPIKAIVIRNPWKRIVSFYIQKIVLSRTFEKGDKLYSKSENGYVGKLSTMELKKISLWEKSFSEFIDIISDIDIYSTEYHLSPQSVDIKNKDFDIIINLDNISDDIKPLLSIVNNEGFKITHLSNTADKEWIRRDKEGNIKKIVKNPSPRVDIVLDNAFDLNPSELMKTGIPLDYSYFYNSEIIEKVHEIYKDDINKFNFECPYKK
jgi:hypothetical protein